MNVMWTDEIYIDEWWKVRRWVVGEGAGAPKLNWWMYIMEMCVHVCEFASPWSGSRLNNQIFDLGLEGRFNPRNGEKVFSQVAFMQFLLLEQFYRNESLQFPQRGQD